MKSNGVTPEGKEMLFEDREVVRRAIELFYREYIGQDQEKLMDWATSKAREEKGDEDE